MKKKIITILTVIIALLIVGGVFWWKASKEEKKEDKWRVQWSGKNDYFIEETSTGRIIKNKKIGFSILVPEGWQIKELDGAEYGISLLSPDAEFDDNYFLVKGCGIGIEAFYDLAEFGNTKGTMDLLAGKTKEYKYGKVLVHEEVIEISGRPALKITRKLIDSNGSEKLGEIVEIKVPFGYNGIIHIGTQFLSGYREKCSQEFDKFLETVSF